jgi:hypothetical protein
MKTINVVFNNGSICNWQLHKDVVSITQIMECRCLQFKKDDGEYVVINLDIVKYYEIIDNLEIKNGI